MSEFKSLNERDLINRKINLYHLKKLYNDVLKYLQKYIKDFR